MERRAQGVAGLALALGLGLVPSGAGGAPPPPRCPCSEGNPVAFTGPSRIAANTPFAVSVRSDLSERIDVDVVTARGKRVLTRSTDRDFLRIRIGGLAPGTYRLRARAAFAYPVPETGELGLCLRVNGRVLTVRPG